MQKDIYCLSEVGVDFATVTPELLRVQANIGLLCLEQEIKNQSPAESYTSDISDKCYLVHLNATKG